MLQPMKRSKCIVTNDDGIDAPGLSILTNIVRRFADPVVVAPFHVQSGVGHRVTTHRPIVLEKRAEDRYAIDGSPADCARIGLKAICPDAEWVFAGINPGANLGTDVYNSGTVAAAREAALLGSKALAISQYIARNETIDWSLTGHHAESAISEIMTRNLPENHFWNINLPHPILDTSPIDLIECEMDPFPHAYKYVGQENTLVYKGIIHDRPREKGADVDICFGGRISATCMPVRIRRMGI